MEELFVDLTGALETLEPNDVRFPLSQLDSTGIFSTYTSSIFFIYYSPTSRRFWRS